MKTKKADKIATNIPKKKRVNKTNSIATKVNNTSPIRILYKKSGQAPEVKIIDNIYKLKKAIVEKNLDIIPYETVYVICTNKKEQDKNKTPNIVLDFYNITGDLLLVDIDKNKREFKGLSQEDVIWYTQDLINKSFNTNNNTLKITNNHKIKEHYTRNFESNNILNDFEKELINVLVNIELVLASIFKNNNESEDTKHE